MRWIAGLAITLLSCSGGSTPPPRPPTPTGSEGKSRLCRDAQQRECVAEVDRVETPAHTEPPPSAAECEALVVHAIELGTRERAAATAPTEAERAQLRATLQPFVDECTAMPRESYRCALAATTTAQLAGCQATRSSSTSNSSVAPGGITPAAPRSP